MGESENVWETMSRDLATHLATAADPPAERRALATAAARYARERAARGEPPFEHLEHFFGVDGAAVDATVHPALFRPKVDDATFDRWMSTLRALPRRLDELDREATG